MLATEVSIASAIRTLYFDIESMIEQHHLVLAEWIVRVLNMLFSVQAVAIRWQLEAEYTYLHR